MPHLNVNLLMIIKGADCQRKNVSCGPGPPMATKGRRAEKEEETGGANDSFHEFDNVTYMYQAGYTKL